MKIEKNNKKIKLDILIVNIKKKQRPTFWWGGGRHGTVKKYKLCVDFEGKCTGAKSGGQPYNIMLSINFVR